MGFESLLHILQKGAFLNPFTQIRYSELKEVENWKEIEAMTIRAASSTGKHWALAYGYPGKPKKITWSGISW